jgi:PiT family inorganic phosphate transporter
LLIGFYMAWNIGANDVSNAMGTSVGSRALTLRQAVFLAAIFEFCGAYFAGSEVSQTMQSGLIHFGAFTHAPQLLIYGMCGALLGTGIWLQIASYFGWPVSTTHAIVGAILGFGAWVGGIDALRWDEIGSIALSWIVSPLASGIIAYLIFSLLQRNILYAMNPIRRAVRAFPLFLFVVFSTFTVSLLLNGLKNLHLVLSPFAIGGIAAAVGLLAAAIGYGLLRAFPVSEDSSSEYQTVEKLFAHLQILSACYVAFAHGANDVSNAVGPIAAVLDALDNGIQATAAPIPAWLLALGGLGIVIGLATWGWRVIETIGRKITELTPTRGFSAEFGAATTILIASKLGLPISTTHCLVGAVLGVGLARGLKALNLGMLRDIALSWIITLPVSAAMSIACFLILNALFG